MTLLLDTLERKTPTRAPFWFMRQAGRYLPEYREIRKHTAQFLDLCFNPKLATEITLQPIQRFGMDAAILFSDILVIPHALGQKVWFEQGEGPKLAPFELEKLTYNPQALAPVLETVRGVRAQLAKDKTLIGFAGSPWTVACYMVEGGSSKEFAKVRGYAITGKMQQLIDTISDATFEYLSAQVKAGAQVLQLFDSWAGILPESEYRQWVIAPTHALVHRLKEAFPHIPIIGFPRLSGVMYKDYARATGVDGMSIDYSVPIDWAMRELSPFVTLQGNLDPVMLAQNKERALAEAQWILDAAKGKPFIFNLGHGVLQHTPVENVQALSDFLKAAA